MTTPAPKFAGSIEDVFAGIHDLLAKSDSSAVRVLYVEAAPRAAPPSSVDGPVVVGASPSQLTPGDNGYRIEWNLQGHAVIAYMAQQILSDENPDALRRLQAAIAADPDDRGDIGQLAMWPDRIKHPPPDERQQYEEHGWVALGQRTKSMHFIDIPYDPASNKPPVLPDIHGTVVEGLPLYLKALHDWSDASSGTNALAFVIHFAGDLHQPLHCACLKADPYVPPDYDQGGNLIAWGNAQKRPPCLHALWDDAVAARPNDVLRQVAALLAKYSRLHFASDLNEQDVTKWALDSHAAARLAYDRFLKACPYDRETQRYAAPPASYKSWAVEVAQERAALAAYRLADLLSTYLPDEPSTDAGPGGGGGPGDGGPSARIARASATKKRRTSRSKGRGN